MLSVEFRKARRLGLALFLCLFAASPALAHPHVWIDMRTDMVMGPDRTLGAVSITWTFDEFYTAFAVQDFKKRADGTYNQDDLDALLNINLENLKEWNYFTEIKQAGQDLPLGTPKPVSASYDAKLGQLTIAFSLPLVAPVTPTKAAPVTLQIFDPTYYISIEYVKDAPLRLTGETENGCAYEATTPDVESIWTSLPESAFANPEGTTLGRNFATNVTLTCDDGV